jgi:hypothetical protein
MKKLIILICVALYSGMVLADDANKFTLTAVELATAYDKNEVAFKSKYNKKIVTINGIIQDIGVDITGQAFVLIGGEDLSLYVACSFPKNRDASVMKLNKGEFVTIRGVVRGGIIAPNLDNSKVVTE